MTKSRDLGNVPNFFTVKAWINFNGTGTIATRDSGGVSGITDLGTGLYQVSFSPVMSSANYSVGQSAGYGTTSFNDVGHCAIHDDPLAASVSVRVVDTNTASTSYDFEYVLLQVTI